MKMNNTQPTKSTPKARIAKSKKSQDKRQKFVLRVKPGAFIVLAVIFFVNGTRDVLSGKSALDVIPSFAQGIEFIFKANRSRKNLEESDRT